MGLIKADNRPELQIKIIAQNLEYLKPSLDAANKTVHEAIEMAKKYTPEDR